MLFLTGCRPSSLLLINQNISMTTEQIKSWFNRIADIIFDLQIAITNLERLQQSKYEDEDWVKRHGFFLHHQGQLWFIIHIQLSKLFDDRRNQTYNVNKLLRELEKETANEEFLQIQSTGSLLTMYLGNRFVITRRSRVWRCCLSMRMPWVRSSIPYTYIALLHL